VNRLLRRRGQVLVVVGALLGTLIGVVLGLAVRDPQAPTAVAALGREDGAVLAVHPPSRQPSASQPAGSGERADGDGSSGSQRTKPPDRPDHGHGNGGKDGEGRQDKAGNGKPGKDAPANGKPGKGKDK
jgi:hypothetical protein